MHCCRHASLPGTDAVAVAKHPPHCYQGCHIFVQCEPAACREMEARYGVKPRVSEREAFNNRFLMVVDGNTFSSRHGHCASKHCILAAWPAPANSPAAALCTLQVHSAFLQWKLIVPCSSWSSMATPLAADALTLEFPFLDSCCPHGSNICRSPQPLMADPSAARMPLHAEINNFGQCEGCLLRSSTATCYGW